MSRAKGSLYQQIVSTTNDITNFRSSRGVSIDVDSLWEVPFFKSYNVLTGEAALSLPQVVPRSAFHATPCFLHKLHLGRLLIWLNIRAVVHSTKSPETHRCYPSTAINRQWVFDMIPF